MATSNFGTLCAYDINKENWQNYVEHLKLFFTTNDVNDAESYFINVLWNRNLSVIQRTHSACRKNLQRISYLDDKPQKSKEESYC